MTAGRRLLMLAAVVAGVTSACSRSVPDAVLRAAPAAAAHVATTTRSPTTTSSTTSTSTTSSTTSTTVPGSTTTPPPPPPGLVAGARGPEVLRLEQALVAQHYDVGTVDDLYDKVTAYAVMAFQKVHRMERTGRANDDVLTAVYSSPAAPGALVPGGNATRVEIDLARQVLFLYEAGSLTRILPVSSGSGRRFCSQGYCRNAVTPGGAFGVYRTGRGWERGPLGDLYNPLYFNGGIAIHGSASVPAGPASHGCIRIPMNAAEWFPGKVPIGTAVYVLGGPGDKTIGVPAEPTPVTTPSTVPTTATTVAPLLGGLFSPPSTAPVRGP